MAERAMGVGQSGERHGRSWRQGSEDGGRAAGGGDAGTARRRRPDGIRRVRECEVALGKNENENSMRKSLGMNFGQDDRTR